MMKMDADNEHFNSNKCNGNSNPCCEKLKSRVSELELEISNLKMCISSLNSQLHEAHEKAEDISFIKNESVITLADKLDAVTSMLGREETHNIDIMECRDNLVKQDLPTLDTSKEVCVKVMNELLLAEHKMSEISNCIEDIKLVCSLKEEKVSSIVEERKCID